MDTTRVTWRKARRSTGGGDNCVEVADLTTAVGVRDSKAPAEVIRLAPSAWRRLAGQARAGRYDL